MQLKCCLCIQFVAFWNINYAILIGNFCRLYQNSVGIVESSSEKSEVFSMFWKLTDQMRGSKLIIINLTWFLSIKNCVWMEKITSEVLWERKYQIILWNIILGFWKHESISFLWLNRFWKNEKLVSH